ncbi:MAG TPA: alpha/beta hydrolase [Flavitalea sp.]|nr:alpha/beta hydrolase [Flavitalea sp.]
MKHVIELLILMTATLNAISQTVIPLYRDSIPNSKEVTDEEKTDTASNGMLRISKVSRPTLTVYFPPKEKATGTAVIICPGGSYSILAVSHEGHDVAKRFNEMGVAAFVLKYRLPDEQTMANKEIGPLQDAQRAIQLVRENAKKWRINENKIGIMGFSAGGHLASTTGTHYQKSYIANPGKINLRPDFLILVYPVISFNDSIAHTGSRDNLLGKDASSEKIHLYSNETQVTRNTPPTFLVHAKDDPVKVQNSLIFAEALAKNNVPYRIYLYEKGGHGYGMNNPTSDVKWMDLVEQWMKEKDWPKKKN